MAEAEPNPEPSTIAAPAQEQVTVTYKPNALIDGCSVNVVEQGGEFLIRGVDAGDLRARLQSVKPSPTKGGFTVSKTELGATKNKSDKALFTQLSDAASRAG